jgi:hypothetical protein
MSTKLTNTTGTSNNSFSISDMIVEYVADGVNDGAKLSFPGYSPVYIRALNPNVPTKWLSGTSAPLDSQGNNGDYFLKTDSGEVYYKLTNFWSVIANLIGPEGPQGAQGNTGATGPTGPTGIAGPSAAVASAQDVVLSSLETGDLLTWNAISGKWINVRPATITDGGNI